MLRRASRAALLVLLWAGIVLSFASLTTAQTSPPSKAPAQLKITGAVATPLTLSISDLKALPRTTLHVTNPHEKKDEVYEGVLLEELLHRVGVPHGEQLRGPLMASYVVAEAADGYRVAFSLAELDSGILESGVLVADTMDGAPIPPKFGPLRLVAPHDKRPARWVRMLQSITVVSPKD